MAEEKKKKNKRIKHSETKQKGEVGGGGREQRAKAERETCIANNGAKAFLILQRVEKAVELEKKKQPWELIKCYNAGKYRSDSFLI